ncbi:hypothetical protein Tco_1284077 [Tanacetum coccineum]
MIAVNNLESLVSPLLTFGKRKKKKFQTVSQPKPKTQGPKASGVLPKKRNKPNTQKTLVVQATETPPTEKSTRFEVSVPDQNKGKTSSEVKPDTQTLLLTIVADIQALLVDYEDELQADSEDDVFKAGKVMDEDIQEADTKEHQTHLSTKTPTEDPHSEEH